MTKKTRILVGMEIEPSKMDEAADPKVNTLQLWLTAQKIFSALTRSTSDMPQELADMLVFVHDIVKEKFPGEEVLISYLYLVNRALTFLVFNSTKQSEDSYFCDMFARVY